MAKDTNELRELKNTKMKGWQKHMMDQAVCSKKEVEDVTDETKPASIGEYESLLEEFPQLQQFSSQLRAIALLKADAQEEKDLVLMKDSYENVLRLQDRLYAKLVTYLSQEHENQFNQLHEITAERGQICQQLKDKLQDEQKEANELFDKICFCMLVNPRYTFENIILKTVERKGKIEDVSGQSWKWGLHFPLITRLRMAWKLVFGSKSIPQIDT